MSVHWLGEVSSLLVGVRCDVCFPDVVRQQSQTANCFKKVFANNMGMILKSFNLFFFFGPVLSAFHCGGEPESLHLKLFRQLQTYLSIIRRESISQGQLDMFNWSDPELPEQDYLFFWWCFPRLAVEVVRCVWCVLLVSHLPMGMQQVGVLVWAIPEGMGRDSERSWWRTSCELCSLLAVELPVNFSFQPTGMAEEISGQNVALLRNWEVLWSGLFEHLVCAGWFCLWQ